MDRALEEVVLCITENNDYKECIRLRNLMENNTEIKDLIFKIKELQKKYIRSGYDDSFKEEINSLEQKLYEIPIYSIYKRHLDEVNHMIDYVKDEMNDYFYKLLN